MKEYIVGLFNGFLAFFIIGLFAMGDYIAGTILCFLVVSSIFFVFDIIPRIKLKKEAKYSKTFLIFGEPQNGEIEKK